MNNKMGQATSLLRGVPPIVGRSAECVLLREQLASISRGQGQFCILSGEAGIGKTTMVRELEEAARLQGMQVLVGRCYDLMAAPPFGIWRDLASRYRIADSSGISLPAVLTRDDLGTVTSQSEVFDQVWAFLSDLCAIGPTLVVLEDVHWADPASLELLRHIASHLQYLHLCLVITYRVDEMTRQSSLYRQLPALIRESGGVRIDLGRLRRDDLASLVMAHYSLPEQDTSQLVDFLSRHSNGNPFFAVELLRSLESSESGGLSWTGTHWHLGELEPMIVPTLLRQVIDFRLDRLGDAFREPLAVAAVIGEDISLDLWRDVSGLDEDALSAIVEKALEWHVMVARADGDRICFSHALTREALYESILLPRRRSLHRKVGDALIAGRNADPDEVAYHLYRAGDPRAAEWLILAGERAQRAYAWLTAWDRFRTAADVLGTIPRQELQRARLLYRSGRLQRYAGAAHGIEDLQRARRLAELAGDTVLMADATYSEGLLHCFADAWERGPAEMITGIEQMEALPLETLRASWSLVNWAADALPMIELTSPDDFDSAASRLAGLGVSHRRGSLPWFLAASGQLERARKEAEFFLERVEGVGMGPLVLSATGHALFGLGIARAAEGDPVGAHAAFEQARAIYSRIDHHAVIAFTWLTELQDVVLPYAATDRARRESAAQEAQAALERAGGALPADIMLQRAHLPTMLLEGRWDVAVEIASDSTEHGNYMLRRPVTNTIAVIAYHQGRLDGVQEQIRRVLPSGPESAPGCAVLLDALLMQQLAATLAMDAGNRDLARRWLDANNRWLAWSGSVLGRVENQLLWARFELDAGNDDAANERAARALRQSMEPDQPLARIAALRQLGMLAGGGGDVAGAEQLLRRALELADACGSPFERALTRVEQAALGIGDAREALTEAHSICLSLNANPLLARIDSLQARKSARALGGVDEDPAELTTRERDVLRLAARGLTDAQIGEQLFISSRTASQHLRSVYAKLGVHSRAAATRFAIEHRLT